MSIVRAITFYKQVAAGRNLNIAAMVAEARCPYARLGVEWTGLSKRMVDSTPEGLTAVLGRSVRPYGTLNCAVVRSVVRVAQIGWLPEDDSRPGRLPRARARATGEGLAEVEPASVLSQP